MKFTKISRKLLESLNFRIMDETDKYGFAGVESPVSLIAENDDEGILVIIDGSRAELYAYDGCANFDCIDVCDNICALPVKTDVEIQIEKLEAELAVLKKLV